MSSPATPQCPLAGLNAQKTTLLLYPERLCGTIERYHPETRTFSYETLDLPLSTLRTATLCGVAHTPRITVAYGFLIAGLLSPLLLAVAPLWGAILGFIGGPGLFLLLRLLIPIRLLHLCTDGATFTLPIQWWERSDATQFLATLTATRQTPEVQ